MVKPPLVAYDKENGARLKELPEKPTISGKKEEIMWEIEKSQKLKSFKIYHNRGTRVLCAIRVDRARAVQVKETYFPGN